MFAVSSGSIGIELEDIPNQGIRFMVKLIHWVCLRSTLLIYLLLG
jgi:hypothetical protein